MLLKLACCHLAFDDPQKISKNNNKQKRKTKKYKRNFNNLTTGASTSHAI